MRKRAYLLVLLVAVAMGIYFRFNNLRTVPGWYPDEGSNIVISAALARGELAYMAVGQSSFINGHPHLFYLLLAALFRVYGVDILWARILSASLGSLALVLLYPTVKSIAGRPLALASTILYAFYPGAISYARLAFTYSLLTPLYLLALYSLQRYLDSRQLKWMAIGAVCGGLAPATDLAGLALPIFISLVLLFRQPRHILLAIPLLALPTLIWAGWMWSVAGDAFLSDAAFTLSRTSSSLAIQLARTLAHYHGGFTWDLWFAFGSIGLLLLPTRRSRGLIIGLYFCTLLFIMRTVSIGGLGYYFLIPLQPLVAIGIGSLVVQGLPHIIRQFEADLHSGLSARLSSLRWRRWAVVVVNSMLVFTFVISPLLISFYQALILDSLPVTRLESAGMFASPETATQATSYVNDHTSANDVVLASPTIAWLIEAHAADFQMAILATGQDSYHMPGDIPASRFRFDPSLASASYVILDPLWRGWASDSMPEVAAMVDTIDQEWMMERRFGEFEVYRNPSFGGE